MLYLLHSVLKYSKIPMSIGFLDNCILHHHNLQMEYLFMIFGSHTLQ